MTSDASERLRAVTSTVQSTLFARLDSARRLAAGVLADVPLPALLATILAAAIVARSVQIGWSLSHTATAGESLQVLPSAWDQLTQATATTRGANELNHVVSAHLFGIAPGNPESAPSDGMQRWVLSGTIQYTDPESGWAILGESATTTRLRAVGQEVADGYRVSRIFRDHVELAHDGGLLTLNLPSTRRSVAPGLRRSEQRTAALTSTEIDASGEQQQPPDVPMAMAVFKPEPARDSRGHYEGMRLEGSGDEASLAAYGLKRDDVITSVNGRAITSQALAMAALQEISSGTPALVTVRRDSVLQDISLTFQTTGG